jgi:hypothetical protein
VEVVMGGRINNGNFAGDTTRARSRGRLGDDGPDKRAMSVSDDDVEQKVGWTHTRRWVEMLQ